MIQRKTHNTEKQTSDRERDMSKENDFFPNQEYSPTSIIRTSDIRYLDYPDLRRASRDNRLWSRAPTRGPRF